MAIKLKKWPFAMFEMLTVVMSKSKQLQPLVETFLFDDIEFTVRVNKVDGKPVLTDGELAFIRKTSPPKVRA